jgi:hypothetical protein
MFVAINLLRQSEKDNFIYKITDTDFIQTLDIYVSGEI